MNYPFMLIMRNTSGGCIWQAYEVRDDKEVELLTKTAKHNGFLVEHREVGYADETCPGWRDTEDWKNYCSGKLSGRALGQAQAREILKDIRREGPYWLDGYKDWLVSCFSLRGPGDFRGFTPIACWSEIANDQCHQYLVCVKEGKYYVDRGFRSGGSNPYGLHPILAEEQIYPSHIFDWIFKDVIPKHQNGEKDQSKGRGVGEAGAYK